MSAKGFWVTQDGHFVHILPPVSAGAAQAGVRFNMTMWAHASLVVRFGASGGQAGAITLSVFPAFSGGSGVAIPFKYAVQNATSAPFDVFNEWVQATASGVTPTNVANETIVIELDVDDILVANNGTYVELDIAAGSLGSSAQVLDAFGILSAGRFASDLETSVQQ
jgi:hypothetical protein